MIRKSILTLALLCSFSFAQRSVWLEETLALHGIDETVLEMVADDKIMARTVQSIRIFNLDGTLDMALEMQLEDKEQPYAYGAIGYSPWDHRYIVSVAFQDT